LRTERLRDSAAKAAEKISSTFLTVIGVAALAVAVGSALPAEAKKRPGENKPAEAEIPDTDKSQPMILVVSLGKQKVDIYRGTTLITSSQVSTGMPGHATKAGVFSILEKQRYHHSNIYSGAPMPWMNRITWSGTALHAGVVPGYPASHGCIRLPFSFAPKLFQITTVGDNVVVTRDRLAPQPIEHPALFQPLSPPAAPEMVKQEQPRERQSSNTIAPSLKARHLGMIAKADVTGVTTDIPSSLEAEATQKETTQALPAGSLTPESAVIEDTHVHAFDPYAASARTGDHAAPAGRAAANVPSPHALDDEEDNPASSTASAPAPAKIEAALTSTPAEAPTAPAPAQKTEAPAVAAAPMASPPASSVEAKTAETSEAQASTPAPPPSLVVVPVAATAPLPAPAQALANANAQTLPAPASAPDFVPSIVTSKLDAGAKAAAIQAAEPRSTAPLRILVTRRTQRDRIIGVQEILAEKGYLPPLDFDGTLGRPTTTAIKSFQKDNGLPETGAFTDELVQKVYAAAGKGEPPAGHLFVRQEFRRVFDVPVNFRDPETPLGTHLFTVLKFNPGDTTAQWVAISLQGDDATSALDRIEIPNDIRQKISERLTPGSSLIVGDTAINTASLPKGADFLVWAKDTPAKITTVSADGDNSIDRPKKKYRSVRRYNNGYGNFSSVPRAFTRGYPSWPW
jgi:lipoprotein-anchoring transpeptidase ErfK/SrfK